MSFSPGPEKPSPTSAFITLDKDGQPAPDFAKRKGKGLTPGVRITFVGGPIARPQTLYYFTTDLSNEGIRRQPGFIKFCAAQGTWRRACSNRLLSDVRKRFRADPRFSPHPQQAIVQDDSGIPIAAFDPAKWSLRFFGTYTGPIDLFKQHFQPQLQELYRQSNPAPLEFGIGYRWSPRQSTVIVAHRVGAMAFPYDEMPPAPSPRSFAN